jgi:hypothetical protein
MEEKGFAVIIQKGQVLTHPEGDIYNTIVRNRVREGNLYRFMEKHVHALLHDSENLCDLWNMRMGHLHYNMFPIPREIVTSLPYFSVE